MPLNPLKIMHNIVLLQQKKFLIQGVCIIAALLSACGEKSEAINCSNNTNNNVNKDAAIEWKAAFPMLPAIELATNLFQFPDDDNYWYVTRQPGVIVRFSNQKNISTISEVLDIQDRVSYSKENGGETGLLGVAMHPKFSSNHYLFLYYTTKTAAGELESRVARFTANTDGSIDKNSELIILQITRPYANHVGGQLAFDKQGYLYISSGDGGSAGDPGQRGQNLNVLLGKILRIDIDNTSDGHNYSIPKDNPFVGAANTREEIWAWGLRNPWRFSFDSETQQLWTADVGQNTWEEIDIITKGGNYGWGDMEGDSCFSARPNCSTENKIKPILTINHSTGACSIIGGYVYRGKRYPQAYGKYFFTDFCDNTMRSVSYQAGKIHEEKYSSLIQGILHSNDIAKNIVSFAQDNQGELYAIGQAAGIGKQIYKMQTEGESDSIDASASSSSLACTKINGPK